MLLDVACIQAAVQPHRAQGCKMLGKAVHEHQQPSTLHSLCVRKKFKVYRASREPFIPMTSASWTVTPCL